MGTSTTSGNNVLQENDELVFERYTDDLTRTRTASAGPVAAKKRKGGHPWASKKGLIAGDKRILRFRAKAHNQNSLEIGTLPNTTSDCLVPLFDRGLIDLEAVCVFCPPKVEYFTGILLGVRIYILPEFFTYKPKTQEVTTHQMFGKEIAIAAKVEDGGTRSATSHVAHFLKILELLNITAKTSSTNIMATALANAGASLSSSSSSSSNNVSNNLNELSSNMSDNSSSSSSSSSSSGESSLDGSTSKPHKDEEKEEHSMGTRTVSVGSSAAAVSSLDIDDLEAEAGGEDDDQSEARVSKFQLESLYAACQDHHKSILEREQPKELKCTLRRYQKQALHWMVQRELSRESDVKQLHPLWDEYEVEDLTFYVSSFSLAASLSFPQANGSARGGVLADEMGMGKTVECLGLMLANAPPAAPSDSGFLHHQGNVGRTTLVVCPMSLISQWRDEIQRFSDLKVLLYYGDTRGKVDRSQLNHTDVLVTSYGTLTAEFRSSAKEKIKSSLLVNTQWWRIILDEAHIIRNRGTETAKAIFQLKGERRWAVTGTPIQNRLSDVFALLHFLKEDPWADIGWFNTVILKPFEKGDPIALGRLKAVLHPLMLRRTKDMNDEDGAKILELPPRIEETLRLTFSETERDFYEALYNRSQTRFEAFVKEGVVLNKYVQILQLLGQLRQGCNHPFLVLGRGAKEAKDFESEISKFVEKFASRSTLIGEKVMSAQFVEGLVEDLKKSGDARQECPICLSIPEYPVLSECGHLYCRECIDPMFNERGFARCPICRTVFSQTGLSAVPKNEPLYRIDFRKEWQGSAKTNRLMKELHRLRDEDPKTKCVIFSQWTLMLDLVEIPLEKDGFEFLRLDGTLSQKQREVILKDFKTKSSATILLISLKAGGVGLNLVSANVVFFLDSWWNPAVEDQAIQRVHRIGQTKTVYVYRFIVEGTVEEQILELHSRKKFLAASIGMNPDEMKQVRLADLQSLFKKIEK